MPNRQAHYEGMCHRKPLVQFPKMVLISPVVLIWISCIAQSKGEFLSKLILRAERITQCTVNSSTEEFAIRNLKLYKSSRTSVLADSDIFTKIPIDEDLTLFMRVSLWMNGGYKPRYALSIGPVCTSLKAVVPTLFKQIIEKLSVTGKKDCPLPPGNYSLKQIPASTDMVLPSPPGKFKVTWNFNRHNVLVGCLHFDVTGVAAKKAKS